MIIVEGPDGGGKTTLVPFLEAVTGLPSWKPGPYPKSQEEAYVHGQDCIHKLKQDFICDRVTQISEHIYGPIVNNQNFMPIDVTSEFLRLCAQNKWLVIYCRPRDDSLMIKNHVRSENDESDETFDMLCKKLGDVIDAYEDLFNGPEASSLHMSGCFYKYDWTEHGANAKLIEFLGQFLRRNKT